MWPSAVALARWLISHPETLEGKFVLELGAGCGLGGLVAAKIIQDNHRIHTTDRNTTTRSSTNDTTTDTLSVVLTDFNEVVVNNLQRNIQLNDLQNISKAQKLDFYDERNPFFHRETVDIILASDIICQPEDAYGLAKFISQSLKIGGKAIIISADSKHRYGVEQFESACQQFEGLIVVTASNVEKMLNSCLAADMNKTAGYVHDMKLILYHIEKIK